MRSIRNTQSGMAMVELAIMATVLTVLLMGTIDFARVFYNGVTVTDAARAGAQYGIQSNTYSGDNAGMRSAAGDNARNVPGFSATSERFCKCRNGSTVNCLTGTCAEGSPQIYVRVTGQNTFRMLASYPSIPSQVNLNNAAVFRLQ